MAFATIGSIDIHYKECGVGDPLLFLHGLGSSMHDWEKQVAEFKNDYRVITCDCRGHGDSSKPAGPYSIKEFSEDIAGLIEFLKLPPVAIVGVSMGAMIGLEFTLNHPERVSSLTLVNSLPRLKIKLMTLIKRWLFLNIKGMEGMANYLGETLLPGEQHDDLRNDMKVRWLKNDPAAYRASSKAILKWSASERLSQVKVPVAIISSEFDYWSLPLKKQLFCGLESASYYELTNAHHLPSVECPERFNALLRKSLSDFG